MKYSILHLSDLHRDLNDEVSNSALLESISRDVERYREDYPDAAPLELCIVSGDLVYGVGLDNPDPMCELSRQYGQAEEFLNALCEELFQGDREKIVIIPGNHDVCYPDAMASMELVLIPTLALDKSKIVSELFKPKSNLRWSWKDLQFYRIVDRSLYDDRLKLYAEFQGRFYKGRKPFDTSSSVHLSIFEFKRLGLVVFALNSCWNNDPLNRTASIHPDSLSELSRVIRNGDYRGRLLACTWHHNISGGPTQIDYMDGGILQHMIEWGISPSAST